MAITTYSIQKTADLAPLQAILDELVGEKSRKIVQGYADSFYLAFGAEIPLKVLKKKFPPEFTSAWLIATYGTTWRIDVPDGEPIQYETDVRRKEAYFEQFADVKVTEATVLYPSLGLRLSFENGFQFWLLPVPEDDEYDLPYWKVTTPDGIWFKVGPKAQWSREDDTDDSITSAP